MLDHDVLQSTLDRALRGGGDFAEVFVEDRRSSNARYDDGRVEELVSGRDRGAGLRVVRGDTTGFAHTADLSPEGLSAAADAAAAAARGQGGAITSVTASYADAHRRILVANSDGLLADDDQVRTRMMVQCVAT